jgi:NAD(P)-dependent dehydrogenase (short-subunit alcohol dehydrogenase family)
MDCATRSTRGCAERVDAAGRSRERSAGGGGEARGIHTHLDQEEGMRMRLSGRVAAITGGALGIGRATALAFAAEGASVALGDVQVDAAQAVAREIGDTGGRAVALGVDVGDAAQVQAFVDRVVQDLGRLDILFANAGIAHSAPFLEHPEAQWHRVLRVNLTGVFLCCQAAARRMAAQGGGRIIATASINGFRGVENLVGYNVAKAGVIELTRTMAVELAEHHITVNAIAPAQIDTRMTRSLPEDARRRRLERIPMGRFGEPEEVARAAVFLASDDASFITGHTLAVDGGYLAGGLWSRRPTAPA